MKAVVIHSARDPRVEQREPEAAGAGQVDEPNPIQRRQPQAAISAGNRAPVMKETASDMV